jgi:hypothetical protein
MTLTITYGGADVTDDVWLEGGIISLTSTANGSADSVAALSVDDPDGGTTLLPLGEVIVEESACSDSRCFTGTALNLRISRGPYRSGPGRVWEFDVPDLNELMKRRILRGSDANRPAESGSDRIDWLLTTVGMAGVVFDNGAIAANSWTYEATDYRGQYALDVMESIVSASGELGRVFFVYWDQTAGQPSLFYASPNAVLNDSTLAITNVMSDVDDSTVFAPYVGSDLEAQGEAIFDGVYVVYTGGVLYRQRASTFTTYGVHVDGTFTWDRITNATYAATHAETFLDRHSGQIDTINCTVRLPRDKVNFIDAGMRIQVKFEHLPGFTSWTYTRVTRRTLVLTAGTNLFYDLQLELSVRGLDQTGGGSPGTFPHQDSPPGIVQRKFGDTGVTGTITLDTDPTEGNWLVAGISSRGTAITLSAGWTEHPHGSITPGSDVGKMAYRQVGPGESAVVTLVTAGGGQSEVWEVSGIDGTPDTTSFADVDTFVQPASIDAGTLSPTAGINALMFLFLVQHNSDYGGNGPTTMSTPSGWTLDGEYEVANVGDLHPNVQASSRQVTSTSGTYGTSSTIGGAAFNYAGWGGLALVFAGSSSSSAPDKGQWVYGEVVTITGTSGTTRFPYATGSLIVHVDGVVITRASYVETNPITGDFDLTWDPDPDEVVTVDYQGR